MSRFNKQRSAYRGCRRRVCLVLGLYFYRLVVLSRVSDLRYAPQSTNALQELTDVSMVWCIEGKQAANVYLALCLYFV